MAYQTKLDESIYPAGYADLRDSFYDGAGVYGQLVEGQWSFGETTYGANELNNYAADHDYFHLGFLDPGNYSVSVDDWSWDFVNYAYGSISSFALYDYNGTQIDRNFGSYSDIFFTVTTPSEYYVSVEGFIGSSLDAQYRVAYQFLGSANSPAQFWEPTFIGSPKVGSTILAGINYFDADGVSNPVLVVHWFADGALISTKNILEPLAISNELNGKTLSYEVAFYDDLGYLETSSRYQVGQITTENTVASWENPTFNGENKAGSSIYANVDFIDPDGNSDNTINVEWYVDGQLVATKNIHDPYVPEISQVGKNLQFRINFTDDLGYLETSPIYNIGIIAQEEFIYQSDQPHPTENTFGPTGVPSLDVVLNGSKWEFPTGVSRTLDWALVNGDMYWNDQAATQSEIAAILAGIEQFIDVDFQYIGSFDSAEAAFLSGSEISYVAENLQSQSGGTLYGVAFFPSLDWDVAQFAYDYGDVYLNGNLFADVGYMQDSDPNLLAEFRFVTLHETGHALGLKHPFHPGLGGQGIASDLGVIDLIGASDRGEVLFSVMSYENDGAFASASAGIPVPLTPMIYDIAALQYLYGENATIGAGDNLYEVNQQWLNYFIYNDVAGYDTIDASSSIGGLTIAMNARTDVLPDQFLSYTINKDDEFPYDRADAFVGQMEKVIASDFDDTLAEASADLISNEYHTLGGNDNIGLMSGHDFVDGGDDFDTLSFASFFTNIDNFGIRGGNYYFSWDGNETEFVNIEEIRDLNNEPRTPQQLYQQFNFVNSPPVIQGPTTISGPEDKTIEQTYNITDVDGDELIISFGSASHGIVIDLGSLGYSYMPNRDFHGTDSFKITVSDGTETVSQDVNVIILPTNDTPYFSELISGIPAVGNTISVDTRSISDRDGIGAFSYQWMIDGIAIDGATGQSFSIQSDYEGKVVSVEVSYVDGDGTNESINYESPSIIVQTQYPFELIELPNSRVGNLVQYGVKLKEDSKDFIFSSLDLKVKWNSSEFKYWGGFQSGTGISNADPSNLNLSLPMQLVNYGTDQPEITIGALDNTGFQLTPSADGNSYLATFFLERVGDKKFTSHNIDIAHARFSLLNTGTSTDNIPTEISFEPVNFSFDFEPKKVNISTSTHSGGKIPNISAYVSDNSVIDGLSLTPISRFGNFVKYAVKLNASKPSIDFSLPFEPIQNIQVRGNILDQSFELASQNQDFLQHTTVTRLSDENDKLSEAISLEHKNEDFAATMYRAALGNQGSNAFLTTCNEVTLNVTGLQRPNTAGSYTLAEFYAVESTIPGTSIWYSKPTFSSQIDDAVDEDFIALKRMDILDDTWMKQVEDGVDFSLVADGIYLNPGNSTKAIGSSDALGALRILINKDTYTYTTSQLLAADFDNNGMINVMDVYGILNFSVNGYDLRLDATSNVFPTWLLVNEISNKTAYVEDLSPISITEDLALNITAVLTGDVSASYGRFEKGQNMANWVADETRKLLSIEEPGQILETISADTTTFNSSHIFGDIVADLANIPTGILESIITGMGNDIVAVEYFDLSPTATIALGAGEDTLKLIGAGAVSQLIMSGVETLDITSVTDGATTISMYESDGLVSTIVAGLSKINADVNYAANVAFVGDSGAKNIDIIGASATASSITTDTTGAVDIDVSANSAATATALNKAAGNVSANSASSIDISVTGNVNLTGTIAAAQATSAALTVSGAAQTAILLTAAKAETATITADKNVTLAANTDLSGAKVVTISSSGAFQDSSTNGLDAAQTLTLSGSGSKAAMTFDTLVGATDLAYSQTVTATGLKAGLTFTGGVDAGSGSLTVDASGVTGAVDMSKMDAAGTVTYTASSLGANTLDQISGKNVIINATDAIGGVSYTGGSTDISLGSTLTLNGPTVSATDVDVVGTAAATSMTATVTGSIVADTYDFTPGVKTKTITISGDGGLGTDNYTVTLVDYTGATGSNTTDTVTVDLSGIVADTTMQSAVIIDIDAETTNALTITGSNSNNDTINIDGAKDYSDETVTISGIEKLTIDDNVSFKATTLSGQNIEITGASTDVVTLSGTVAADTISTANLISGGHSELKIDSGADNDTIILGAMIETVMNDGYVLDGYDVITGFTSGTDFIDINSTLITEAGGKATDASTVTYAESAIIDYAADTSAGDAESGVIWWVSEQLNATTTAATAVENAVTELSDGAADFSANFTAGEGGLIIMDNGSDTFIFEYKAAGAAAVTEVGDLTLVFQLVEFADGDALIAADFV